MKIKDIKISNVEVPLSEPGFCDARAPDRVRKKWRFNLLKLFTDEGIVGIGVQDVPYPEWGKIVERTMKPFLVNQIVEPFYIEKFIRFIRTQPFGTYLSPRPCAIEIALWDAVGKKAKLPVYKLFGAYQDKVKAYASTLEEYPLWNAKKWCKFTENILEEGFKAIKLHIGLLWQDPHKVIDVIKIMRDKLGYDFDIMIDAMQAWKPNPLYDLKTAIKYARGLEKYECAWLEESLPHFNNPDLSAQLCNAVDIPIAGGGAMFGLHTYKTILEKGALDIVQPDVMHAGGLQEVRRIALLAEAYGRQCIPHSSGVGIMLAATLQVIGSSNIPWLEYRYHPPAISVEARDCMLKKPIKINADGYVEVPKGPGLGIEINEEIVEKSTVIK